MYWECRLQSRQNGNTRNQTLFYTEYVHMYGSPLPLAVPLISIVIKAAAPQLSRPQNFNRHKNIPGRCHKMSLRIKAIRIERLTFGFEI